MCLDLHWWNTKEHTAKKNIVVYKVVKTNNNETDLRTLYQGYIVKIGETYFSELSNYYAKIYVGLHSFKYKKAAKSLAFKHDALVVKCIIPKGSTYYKGSWDSGSSLFGYVGYASTALKYMEEVK